MDSHLAHFAQFGRNEHRSLSVDAKLTYIGSGVKWVDKVKLLMIIYYHRRVADNGRMCCCDWPNHWRSRRFLAIL